MVFFCCEGCNETLKKKQIERHFSLRKNCRSVSCVDCSQVFYGNEYDQHNICISEAEKYEKSLYKKKTQKRSPQEIWMDVINESIANIGSLSLSHQAKNVLKNMQNYPNVPRNENKFKNFISNCMKVRDTNVQVEIWKYLSSKKSNVPENDNVTNLNQSDITSVDTKENENNEAKTDEENNSNLAFESEKKSRKKRKKDEEANNDGSRQELQSNKKRKCGLISEENKPSKTEQPKIKWKKYVKHVFTENEGPIKLKKLKKIIVKQILAENDSFEKSTVKSLFDENISTFKHISIENDMVSYK